METAHARMASRVSGFMRPFPVSALETVASERFMDLAISEIRVMSLPFRRRRRHYHHGGSSEDIPEIRRRRIAHLLPAVSRRPRGFTDGFRPRQAGNYDEP